MAEASRRLWAVPLLGHNGLNLCCSELASSLALLEPEF